MTQPPQYPFDPTGAPPPNDPTSAPGSWSPTISDGPYGANPGPATPSYGSTPGYGYGTPAPAQPSYGAPASGAPAYGAPAYGAPGSVPPAYGAPGSVPPAYGAPGSVPPAYGAPGYGAPGYGQPAGSPYGGYPFPGQTVPKKSGGKTAIIIVVVVVAVLAISVGAIALLGNAPKHNTAGPGASGSPTASTPATTPATSSSPTSPASATPTTPGGLLFSKIVPPPDGSESYTFDKAVNGVFTAQQIADQTFKDPKSEAARLTAAGFVVAAGRDYTTPDGDEIVVFLLQFKKPDGAKSTYNNVVSGRAEDKTVTGKFTVPGGHGYEWNKIDNLGNRRSEMYKEVANVLIILNVYTPGDISVSSDLQMLSDQVSALS